MRRSDREVTSRAGIAEIIAACDCCRVGFADAGGVYIVPMNFAYVDNGALGALSTGCYAKTGEAFDSKITFSAKDCRLEHYILGKVNIFGVKQDENADNGLIFKGDGTMQAGKDCVTIKEDGAYGGVQCDRTFVDAVLSGDPSKIRSPYADAVRTMEFVMACNRSMETGLPVKVEHK